MLNMLLNKAPGESEKSVSFIFTLKPKELFGKPNIIVVVVNIFVNNILEISVGELYRCSEFGKWIKMSFVLRRMFNIGEIILHFWYHERTCRKTIIGTKILLISAQENR